MYGSTRALTHNYCGVGNEPPWSPVGVGYHTGTHRVELGIIEAHRYILGGIRYNMDTYRVVLGALQAHVGWKGYSTGTNRVEWVKYRHIEWCWVHYKC